jgi:plastocyanin
MQRTKLVILVALFALVALVVSGCYGSSATPTKPAATTGSGATTGSSGTGAGTAAATAVSIANFAFDPASVTVKVGDTVTWTNNDSTTHTITGDGGLDSGDVAPGSTFSKTFDKAGTYKYHCSIHPTMTGEVVVQ